MFNLQIDAAGNLTYTPAANANGLATVTVILKDDGGTANGGSDTFTTQTFTITVNSVNDAPSFVKGADQTITATNLAVTGTPNPWATSISKGPVDESGQTLAFITNNNNNSLFYCSTSNQQHWCFDIHASIWGSWYGHC